MKITMLAITLFSACLLSGNAVSDVLLIDAISQETPNSSDGLPRPTRSMKMSTVREKFGEPVNIFPAVGEPPITRWDFDGYSVYFEHDLVLTTVVHRK